MTRREFLRAAGAAAAASALGPGLARAVESRQPNILWITCEDTSPNLGCYGDRQARTPNLDRLAAQGARYANAFTVAGVCAPSRSCIITGMYPASIGTHHMRCRVTPPAPVRCFTEYLREAGYYCTNNVKTDYNFPTPKAAWDECGNKAHWRNRPSGRPFFSVFNITTTHESRIAALPRKPGAPQAGLDPAERHDPAKADPPPYYPDTSVVRAHLANDYDLITIMDRQAGGLLGQLEDEGLADDTVVFFFSDHGVGLPRAKRWIYDSGIHVPLIIRWPGQIQPGTVNEDLVSFVDFAPALLSAAGVPIPGHLQGQAFLGPQKARAPRQYVYAERDRMDERYDIIRAVRDKRYKHIRNFEPYKPYDQYISYCESKPVMKEMRRVHEEGNLTGPAALFFRQEKPVEELYDIQADPCEVNNLAGSPEHRGALERLRAELERWMIEIEDLGLVPEPLLGQQAEPAAQSGSSGADSQPSGQAAPAPPIPLLGRPAADLAGRLDDPRRIVRLLALKALAEAGAEAAPALLEALRHDDPAMRYWAAVHLGAMKPAVSAAIPELEKALQDDSAVVQIAAAYSLWQLNRRAEAAPALIEGLKNPNPSVRLYAADALDRIGPDAAAAAPALEGVLKDKNKYVVRIAEHALGVWGVGGKRSDGKSGTRKPSQDRFESR